MAVIYNQNLLMHDIDLPCDNDVWMIDPSAIGKAVGLITQAIETQNPDTPIKFTVSPLDPDVTEDLYGTRSTSYVRVRGKAYRNLLRDIHAMAKAKG